jgi:hypothetical protein
LSALEAGLRAINVPLTTFPATPASSSSSSSSSSELSSELGFVGSSGLASALVATSTIALMTAAVAKSASALACWYQGGARVFVAHPGHQVSRARPSPRGPECCQYDAEACLSFDPWAVVSSPTGPTPFARVKALRKPSSTGLLHRSPGVVRSDVVNSWYF